MAQPDPTKPPPARPPRRRNDPAAMREALDAARRRLVSASPGTGEPQSAAELRGLLRAAAAAHGEPGHPTGSPPSPLPPPTTSVHTEPDTGASEPGDAT